MRRACSTCRIFYSHTLNFSHPLKKTAFLVCRSSIYNLSIYHDFGFYQQREAPQTFPFPRISSGRQLSHQPCLVLLICNGLYITDLTSSYQYIGKGLDFYYLLLISGIERITTPWRLFSSIDMFPTLQFSF